MASPGGTFWFRKRKSEGVKTSGTSPNFCDRPQDKYTKNRLSLKIILANNMALSDVAMGWRFN